MLTFQKPNNIWNSTNFYWFLYKKECNILHQQMCCIVNILSLWILMSCPLLLCQNVDILLKFSLLTCHCVSTWHSYENTHSINCTPVTVTVPLELLHGLIHSPQPPLFPSFILLCPLKFIHKIYSVTASIFTTWKWTHTLPPPPPHSPQPPLSPSFILMSPLKFIHKIDSMMA